MFKYQIEGGRRLLGCLTVHGAKNSVLPILSATLLSREKTILHNCPSLTDVEAAIHIMEYLGCTVERQGTDIQIDPSGMNRTDIPEQLMHEMRSSIIFMGAILSRSGHVSLYSPGGCELGPRPIDLHLKALRQLGARITDEFGMLECRREGRLVGCEVVLSFPSVGATENTLLAAVTAQGTTTIVNAAREPEIVDLAAYLNACGAKIRGAGEETIVVEGVAKLHGAEHTVIPDRIAAVTYMAAAAVTGGEVELRGTNPRHLAAVLPLFEEMGCLVYREENLIVIKRDRRMKSARLIRTAPYPGFPTDAQALLMSMAIMAGGTTTFVENIFENRYRHVAELRKLGAKIQIDGRVATVEGVRWLKSADLTATDLRGGAAMALALLASEGTGKLSEVHHIDRGYENFTGLLTGIGASIRRIEE